MAAKRRKVATDQVHTLPDAVQSSPRVIVSAQEVLARLDAYRDAILGVTAVLGVTPRVHVVCGALGGDRVRDVADLVRVMERDVGAWVEELDEADL